MSIAPGPRVLSIRQPWVWAILSGKKRVENRTWTTDYRGEVYLHASKAVARGGIAWLTEEMGLRAPSSLPLGAIAGTCVLKDVITRDRERRYGRWFEGPYGLVLGCPRTLPRPIPYLGRLGLFTAPPSLVRKVGRQLPSPKPGDS
jgi:hypothetical protein